MKRLVSLTACALVCLLCAGCAQKLFSRQEVSQVQKVQIEIQPAPAQPEAAQVCLLDPTSQLPQSSEKPVPAGELSPAVEIKETTHDFGAFCDEKELVHKFSIKNVGKSVLTIKKVVPG